MLEIKNSMKKNILVDKEDGRESNLIDVIYYPSKNYTFKPFLSNFLRKM